MMAAPSRDYYVRYPGDRERVRALAARLDAETCGI
jgi:hypothetical protein